MGYGKVPGDHAAPVVRNHIGRGALRRPDHVRHFLY